MKKIKNKSELCMWYIATVFPESLDILENMSNAVDNIDLGKVVWTDEHQKRRAEALLQHVRDLVSVADKCEEEARAHIRECTICQKALQEEGGSDLVMGWQKGGVGWD